MRRLICVLLGHKTSVKLQITRGYTTYICDRCGNVFARKIDKEKAKKAKEQQKTKEKTEEIEQGL